MNLARTPRWIIAGLALVALVAGALPARAGETSWNDPKDDANGFYILESTPLPSNAALDIVKSTLSTQGADLSWVLKMKDLPDSGYPAHSTGFFFRFGFKFGGTGFQFRVGDDATAPGAALSLRSTGTPAVTVECIKCKAVIDRKTDSVIVTAPIAAMAAGLKKALPDLPPFGPGSELSVLELISNRFIGATLTMAADTANAPEGTAFKV